MQKKTIQRVIGLMAIIGLAIILFPLFQTTKELPAEMNIAQETPPPFPKKDIPEDTIAPLNL